MEATVNNNSNSNSNSKQFIIYHHYRPYKNDESMRFSCYGEDYFAPAVVVTRLIDQFNRNIDEFDNIFTELRKQGHIVRTIHDSEEEDKLMLKDGNIETDPTLLS